MTRGALVVPQEFAEHARASPWELPGLLSWSYAMGWDIRTIHEDLSPYDIYMTNVSSTELEYISLLRQINPDATVVCLLDYGSDVLSDYFSSLERVWQIMGRANHIISVNENQKEWVEAGLRNRGITTQVHHIPHPCDVANMAKFRRPREDRTQGIGAFWHQYRDNNLLMLEVLKSVEKKLKRPVQKSLIGLKTSFMRHRGQACGAPPDKCPHQGMIIQANRIPIVGPDHPDTKVHGQPIDPNLPYVIDQTPPGVGWDIAIPYMGVLPWYDLLSRYEVCLDMYLIESIGRFGIDCAGVGVPLVASKKTDSADILYPFTRVNPFEPGEAVAFVTKLLKDDAFYEKVVRTATKNLPYYGFAKSKERMLRVLEEET